MNKTFSYVYILEHKILDLFYIGYKQRSKIPFDDDYFSSSLYVKKLGVENFTKTIVAVFFNPNDAYQFEQKLIWEHHTNPNIINKMYSKDGVSKAIGPLSEETRKKMSDVAKNRKISDETRKKLSAATKGENNGMYGKTHTDETKRKISRPNDTLSVETKNKMKVSFIAAHANKRNYYDNLWKIKTPSGEIIYIATLKDWCIENSLSYNSIYNSMKNGKPITRGPGRGYWLIAEVSNV